MKIKHKAEIEIKNVCSEELATLFSFSFGDQDDSWTPPEDKINQYLDVYCAITSITQISGIEFMQVIEYGQKKFEKDTKKAFEDIKKEEILELECFQYGKMFPMITVKTIKVVIAVIKDVLSKRKTNVQ